MAPKRSRWISLGPLLAALLLLTQSAFQEALCQIDKKTPKAASPGRTDFYGDPLPDGALARLGTVRFRHWASVDFLHCSLDGGTLLAGGEYDDQVHLWDVETGKKVATLGGHEGGVMAAAFHPDGKTLACLDEENTVHLWDLETQKARKRYGSHNFDISAACFSTGFEHLAVAGEDESKEEPVIVLRETKTGLEILEMAGHEERITSLSFSPDGKSLASGSLDRTIRIWKEHTRL